MAGCILFGHKWTELPGHGEWSGQTFTVCQECGITYTPEREAAEKRLAELEREDVDA